jgi:hypothetical protein
VTKASESKTFKKMNKRYTGQRRHHAHLSPGCEEGNGTKTARSSGKGLSKKIPTEAATLVLDILESFLLFFTAAAFRFQPPRRLSDLTDRSERLTG